MTRFRCDLFIISLALGFRCDYESDGDGPNRREDPAVDLLIDDRSALREEIEACALSNLEQDITCPIR